MFTLDTTQTVAFKMVLLDNLDAPHRILGVAAVTFALALFALYQYLLPKPIPGIPYSPSATKSLLGDIPTMLKECNGTPLRWIVGQGKRWNSPIFQVFLVPFAKPAVVISDFREAQDILMRRKEFDRSDWTIDSLSGEIPQFHLNLKTGPEWKGHRRLLQDLMTPAFLSSVAAPNIYTSAANLVDLWKTKARLAGGRAFSADQDFYHAALDAVLDFGFGDSYLHRALKPQAELLMGQEKQSVQAISATADPVEFPIAQPHESIKAILAAGDLIQDIAESGFVKLTWWWKKLQPRERKLMDQRAQFVKEQVYRAIEKLQKDTDEDSESWVKCAVDLIIQRERKFAKKEGREPVYWSSVMKDELLGFIMAGHDTTSTTLSWGVKLLADCPRAQTKLRQDLRAAHASALVENRAPSHSEISTTRIPYLDAVIEEVLRLAHTAPVMDRQCTQDTVVLGHRIPAGTIVLMPNIGPSYTSPSFEIDEAVRNETSKQAAKDRGVRSWPADGIDVFRPERWLVTDDETGGERYDATSGPAIPFGLGTRGCFGRKLAYLELKLLVTLIIWNFELLPCAKEISTYEPVEGITSRPKHCYVRLGDVAM
ncbi:cytochrome P450 [Colletotrichum graminicola]|uniref:Cytochrome P450 n=1 Tax=Colletotrichum graminicola (strain M1.001 / M2 / FGSC 10212) TaxID=645133 RepID=E3Q290_COLGM|nr:cytochrome P450 [Colletotrichum graminicola M1.001]EFQ25191.1 cytochrome P450 [Colletotrichum graminicola M1.001]WDK15189.1 cytochrome P450 [Colletotrichum graminicola]